MNYVRCPTKVVSFLHFDFLLYSLIMTNTNNIPRWNLDSIFPGLDSAEYKKALDDYRAVIAKMNSILNEAPDFSSDADFLPWLANYLENQNELLTLSRTINAFAYIVYSTDTTNTQSLNNISTVDKISLDVEQLHLKFSAVLRKNQGQLESFFTRYPNYADYRYLLNECIEDTKHQMSAAEENLASDLNRTGGNAWSMLHEQIISNLKDSNGKTFNELRNDAFSADPKIRRESWEKEKNLLEQNEIALGASLNNLKGQTVNLNRRRNYGSALERALAYSRLSQKSLDALIEAIEDSLPMWREYFKSKALLLRKTNSTASKTAGTENHRGLAFYDLFAPLSNPEENSATEDSLLEKNWSFEEARDYVLKEYASFSSDMHDFAKSAFDRQWIDAEVRSGKVGGAYDEDFPLGHQSRILSNFTGTFSDIITLAHELGHAYHFSCMKGLPAAFFDYPMTLAETASTFAETIVKQDMIKQCNGFDKIKIIDLDLQDTSQVLVDILCRFYFEKSVFESRENTELNAEDFCRLMSNAQEKSYGDGLNDEKDSDGNFTERHEYMWAVKSHYYSTDLDFYNFPYAFGQLFAAGLYQQSKKIGPDFAATYSKLLSQTGSTSCEELCKKAGFDITEKDFWKSGIEMYAAEVKEFTEAVQSLVEKMD